MKRRILKWGAALALALAGCLAGLHAQSPSAAGQNADNADDPYNPANLGRLELDQYLNNLAYQKTAARSVTVAHITTVAQARARQAEVRKKILALIGGLPERTPLNARTVGSVQGKGFHIEKVIFDSQPHFPVTALLYLPDALPKGGKLPGILVTPGHSPSGKASDYFLSATLALNGFAVLSYDPIGQGERLQYYDSKTGGSYLHAPTGEHAEAGLQPTLIGDAVSRYFIWDAMRGLDYLQSRPEVDPGRVGAFGCSGGGTDTAMLAALDPHLKAVGVACFTTNYDTLLPSIGPQDAEQSIPNFINSGLGFPDWAELVAPHPYAVVATYQDMFPFAGAQQTVNEVRRFYRIFAAGSQLEFITGPGRHGNLYPILPEIVSFFLKHLQPGSSATKPIVRGRTALSASDLPKDALQDTETGQVATSFPAAVTIHTLNLERAALLLSGKAARRASSTEALQNAIRKVTKAQLAPDLRRNPLQTGYLTAQEESGAGAETDGMDVHRLRMHVEQGIDLWGILAAPTSAGRHPAVLLLTNAAAMPPASAAYRATAARVAELAGAGNVVLALTPRPSPPGTEATKSLLLGDFYITELRAELTGRTILGLRVDDTIRAVNYLSMRDDVDPQRITAFGSYHLGMVLLHAAVLDPRLAHITIDHVLSSYKSLLEAPMPLRACEDILPGVLLYYDTPQLVRNLGARLTSKSPLAGVDDLSPGGLPAGAP